MVKTKNGAMAPPTEDPLSKRATAHPRSWRGNHSETALVAPGQLAASPVPNKNRNRQKLFNPVAREVRAAAQEYQSTEIVRQLRVPSRSIKRPDSACMTAYATRKAIMRRAKSELLQENSALR